MSDSVVRLTHGNMSIGDVTGSVRLSVLEPGNNALFKPSAKWVSGSAAAKSEAHSKIPGCGNWWSSNFSVPESVSYLAITVTSSIGGRGTVASMVLRVRAGAPIVHIEAKMPAVQYSNLIDGKVSVFQGRADILTIADIEELKLRVKTPTLERSKVDKVIKVTQIARGDSELRENIQRRVVGRGRVIETISSERRRVAAVRRKR